MKGVYCCLAITGQDTGQYVYRLPGICSSVTKAEAQHRDRLPTGGHRAPNGRRKWGTNMGVGSLDPEVLKKRCSDSGTLNLLEPGALKGLDSAPKLEQPSGKTQC